jgi:catechol 2,3-dioxygenase-like lactoylglutathione lyase family enzyme
LQDNFRLRCVSLLTSDVGKLRAMLAKRGLAPGEVRKGEDGSLRVAVSGPGGVEIDFVQYVPGSLEAKSRGKFLGPRRVSEHLWHAGIAVDSLDAGMAFYRDKLGFKEFARGGPNNEIRWINMMMPGTHGDYIEQMVHTATPAAARHHLCFAVPDIQAAFKALQQGMPGGYKPFLAQNNHWIVNIKDLNGLRVEIMERGEAKKQ